MIIGIVFAEIPPKGAQIKMALGQNGSGGKTKILSIEKDELLTTKETTGYLKISRATFFKYIRQGKIKAIKVGNSWRVPKSELYLFLETGRTSHKTKR